MRSLILPPVSCLSAIAVKKGVEPPNDFSFRSIPQQLDIDRRERAIEVVGRGKSLFGHPHDGIATLLRHPVTRTDGEDELRRERGSNDGEVALPAI